MLLAYFTFSYYFEEPFHSNMYFFLQIVNVVFRAPSNELSTSMQIGQYRFCLLQFGVALKKIFFFYEKVQ